MSLRFETYLASADSTNAAYVLVVHGQGEGKFSLKKSKAENATKNVYTVTSAAIAQKHFTEFLYSIPKSIEDIFDIGAISFSFHEGEVSVSFPVDFEGKFEQTQLSQIAQNSYQGMSELAGRYTEYKDQLEPINVSYYSGIYAICVLIAISLLGFFYGVRIVPIDWIYYAGFFLALQMPAWIFIVKIASSLRETNKIVLFSIFGANSILFTMLIGLFSLLIYPHNLVSKEGAIEHLFSGQRMNHLMRVRLAENKYRSYLVPKHLLNKNPDYLPQAAVFSIREGLLGSRYIDSVALLK